MASERAIKAFVAEGLRNSPVVRGIRNMIVAEINVSGDPAVIKAGKKQYMDATVLDLYLKATYNNWLHDHAPAPGIFVDVQLERRADRVREHHQGQGLLDLAAIGCRGPGDERRLRWLRGAPRDDSPMQRMQAGALLFPSMPEEELEQTQAVLPRCA